MFAKGAINGINAAIKEIPTVRVNGNPITKWIIAGPYDSVNLMPDSGSAAE